MKRSSPSTFGKAALWTHFQSPHVAARVDPHHSRSNAATVRVLPAQPSTKSAEPSSTRSSWSEHHPRVDYQSPVHLVLTLQVDSRRLAATHQKETRGHVGLAETECESCTCEAQHPSEPSRKRITLLVAALRQHQVNPTPDARWVEEGQASSLLNDTE